MKDYDFFLSGFDGVTFNEDLFMLFLHYKNCISPYNMLCIYFDPGRWCRTCRPDFVIGMVFIKCFGSGTTPFISAAYKKNIQLLCKIRRFRVRDF